MEEPVHDHQQHHDGEKSGRRLQIERPHVVAQRIDNSDRDEPSDQGCAKCDAGAHCHRLSMSALRAGHARGDRRQHEYAFKAFAKNENADIEKGDRRARVRLSRIRRAVRSDSLPHHHPDNHDRGGENANPENDPPRALVLAQSSRTHDEKLITVVNQLLPVGCVFLAAVCAVKPIRNPGKQELGRAGRLGSIAPTY